MGPGVEAFLVYAVAALLSCAVSFVLGRHWPARRQLDEAWEDGADACAVWSSDAYIFRCDLPRGHDGPHQDHDDKGTVEWNDDYMAARPAVEHDADMAARPQVTALTEDVPRPGRADSGADVPREAVPPTAGPVRELIGPGYPPWSRAQAAEESGSDVWTAHGPGRLPSQDTYRAELARIGRPDPAPWYQALVEPDPPAVPGPPAEPAWYERVTYREAIEWGAIKMWHHEDQEVFHSHVDEWDRFIAAWGVEARWVTVGCRAWPPPGLVPA